MPGRDAASFEQLYAAQSGFLVRALRRLGIAGDGLEDAHQEALVVIARRLPDYEARSSLRTWVFGIAQGVAANHRRRVRRKERRWVPLDDAAGHREAASTSRDAAFEAADILRRFVASLDERDRKLFVLGWIEQRPVAELARTLEQTVSAVLTRRRALRDELSRLWSTDPTPRAPGAESIDNDPLDNGVAT